MPKNTTGGKGHKGGKNGEGNTARKNRTIVESFMSDIRSDGECASVYIGRVLQRLGNGVMSVFYVDEKGDGKTVGAPIKGSLRGRGKRQARIEVGSVVLINQTGLSGVNAFSIIAVMTDAQVYAIKEEASVDPRILAKNVVSSEVLKKTLDSDDIVFDYGEEGKEAAVEPDPDVENI